MSKGLNLKMLEKLMTQSATWTTTEVLPSLELTCKARWIQMNPTCEATSQGCEGMGGGLCGDMILLLLFAVLAPTMQQ